MAPHRALIIPDVLHQIFEKLSVRPQLFLPGADLGAFQFPNVGDREDLQASKVKRRTLAYAARTCKAFAEPASNVLWEVMDSFTPIESILRNTHTQSKISEGGEKDHRTWERIEQLARRIRALSTSCWTQTGGFADALAAFCSRYSDSDRAIFPNMRVFNVLPIRGVDGDAWLSFLRAACASPSLALLTMTTDHVHDGTILKILATAAPAPQKLVHLNVPCLGSLDEEGCRALGKFSNLRTAHFMAIDITLLRHLAALPNLQELSGVFCVSRPEVVDMRGAFPALQQISTQDVDQEARGCFLAALPFVSSKSLARLYLRVSVPLVEDMVEYLNELCSSPTTARLRELDLGIDIEFNQFDNQDEPFEGVCFASDVLAHLKRLSALTDISVVVCFQTSTVATFTMTDADLDAVASAWPGLTCAKFGHAIQFDDWDDGPWGIERPSLSAVVALAERCRMLESIDVEFESVDAGELERLEACADACTEPQTALLRIVFDPESDFCDNLCMEDPERLAKALARLFPNLSSGLKMEESEGESGETTVTYRGWHRSLMDTDAFRLLRALDGVDFAG